MSKKYIFFIFLFQIIYSQNIIQEISFYKNPSENSYYWIENNNYGLGSSLYDLEIKKEFLTKDFEIFSSIIFSYSDDSKLRFKEVFLKKRVSNNTFLKIGKYYRDFSVYLDDELSSGSLLISTNAEALPKIGLLSKIEINDKFNVRLGISHAKLAKSKVYNEEPKIHEKFIYLDILMNEKEKFSIGLVHEAIWGGSSYRLGKQPDSFRDFLKILISADKGKTEGEPHTNALGNHLGIWDFVYEKKINSKKLSFYYQHLFEDTSGLRFANKTDGLWGLRLNNYINNLDILIEYFTTKNQSINPPYVDEFYYNHGVYDEGWSYKGKTLGSPFISSTDSSIKNEFEIIYIGLNYKFSSKNSLKFICSKPLEPTEPAQFKVVAERKYKNKSFDFYALNNLNNTIGLGINLRLSF